MSKQPPSAPTASALGPCPTIIQIVGRPGTGAYVGMAAMLVKGWSGGAMVLGKLPVPRHAEASYNLVYSRAMAYCTCSRCGWGLFGHFFSLLPFLSFFSLSLGDGPI